MSRSFVGRIVFLTVIVSTPLAGLTNGDQLNIDEREAYNRKISDLEGRLTTTETRLALLETAIKAMAGMSDCVTPMPQAITANVAVGAATVSTTRAHREPMPPELLPEIGKVGAEVGLLLNTSSPPYGLNRGFDVAGFIDLPLFDRPSWLHGKVSYEISIGLSHSRTTFSTTSNVAQVANLAVLNTLYPNGGLQNIVDAVTGTGTAPFPVTSMSITTAKILQVVPFSFKYTTTALDRFRLRPYALLGFGAYVTIHEQQSANPGVRPDADLPASVISLINQVYGGTAPFGGQLIAGQILQSSQLQGRGLPSGEGNINLGWVAGGGIEYRLFPNVSIGIDGRRHQVAGAPGALTNFGLRLGFHF